MTIINLLNRLAKAAPDVCRKESYPAKGYYGNEYQAEVFYIANIKFFQEPNSELEARYRAVYNCKGRPALAWLRDAIEAAIEAQGWYWEVSYPPHETTGEHWANIRIGESRYFYGDAVDAAEALLAAFVEAAEGENK